MTTKTEQARKLAEVHYEVEPGITQIFRITDSADIEVRPEEPIKLLEVNENTISTGENVMPLYFGPVPARGFDFPTVIVEVTPDEFARIRSNEMALPKGWTVSDLIPKPTKAGGQ